MKYNEISSDYFISPAIAWQSFGIIDLLRSSVAEVRQGFDGKQNLHSAGNKKQLLKLYPSRQDYVDKVRMAVLRAAELGVILPYVAEQYIREAEIAPISMPLED